MSTEVSLNNHTIILVAHRPDDKPPVAYVERMGRRPQRYMLVDARRRLRQLRERLEVMEQVERMLGGVQDET